MNFRRLKPISGVYLTLKPLFYASCRNVTPPTLFAERCTPVVATPTGKSLHSTPLAHQFGLLPSPSLCATGSSAQEKSNGSGRYKKRSNLLSCFLVVGAEGFEPPTLCL